MAKRPARPVRYPHASIAFGLRRLMKREGWDFDELLARLQEHRPRLNRTTLRHWLDGHPVRAEYLELLCELFACEAVDLYWTGAHARDRGAGLLEQDDVIARYRALSEHGEAFVILDRHLIQASAEEIAADLTELTAGGRPITYLFPMPREGDEDGRRALEYEKEIREALERRRDATGASAPIRGFMFDAARGRYRPTDGKLVFLLENHEVEAAFQEIAFRPPSDPRFAKRKGWYELPHGQAESRWKHLVQATLPIPEPTWTGNRVHGPLQDWYRSMFGNPHNLRRYATIRRIVALPEPNRRLDRHVDRILQDGELRRVLDVGPGDFVTSFGLVYKHLNAAGVEYRVTGVDSAEIRDCGRSASSESLRARINARRVCRTFERWKLPRTPFDLALALHSLYFVDPHYLSKLVASVRIGGTVLVLHGAYDDNLFSLMSGAADRFAGRDSRKPPFPGKRIEDDPYRVYAEDLQAWFESHGRALGVQTHEIRNETPLQEVFDARAERLREAGREAIELFLGPRPFAEFERSDEHRALIEALAAAAARAPRYPSKEMLFVVTRRAPETAQLARAPAPHARAGRDGAPDPIERTMGVETGWPD